MKFFFFKISSSFIDNYSVSVWGFGRGLCEEVKFVNIHCVTYFEYKM